MTCEHGRVVPRTFRIVVFPENYESDGIFFGFMFVDKCWKDYIHVLGFNGCQ